MGRIKRAYTGFKDKYKGGKIHKIWFLIYPFLSWVLGIVAVICGCMAWGPGFIIFILVSCIIFGVGSFIVWLIWDWAENRLKKFNRQVK